MATAEELKKTIEDAEHQLRQQRISFLEEQLELAMTKAGEARENVEKLLAQFKEQEAAAQTAKARYEASQSELFKLDNAYAKKRFPTKHEIAEYEGKRKVLTADVDTKREAWISEKVKVEPLRFEVTQADSAYVACAQSAQNAGNMLEKEQNPAEPEPVPRGVERTTVRRAYGFDPIR